MAAPLLTAEYTVTASATPLSTILGLNNRFLSHFTLRAGTANVGNVFIGRSNVTTAANRGGFLKPDESFSVSLENTFTNAEEWHVVGTAGDILHVTALQ